MSSNNFHNENVRRQAAFRLFLVYKPGYYSTSVDEARDKGLHSAYAGGKKYIYSFPKDKDGNGLVNRIAKDQGGHYKLCWMYANDKQDGEIVRAWDEWGNELAPREVAQINWRIKMKKKRQENNVPTK